MRYHHMIAYTRFNVSNKGVLWAILEEGVSPAILNFFVNRYPLFYIMLEYKGETFINKKGSNLVRIKKPVESVVKDYERILPSLDFLKDLDEDSNKLWGEFYDSQYIKERKNHRLFYHFIPKGLKTMQSLKKEFESLNNCSKITSFINKD